MVFVTENNINLNDLYCSKPETNTIPNATTAIISIFFLWNHREKKETYLKPSKKTHSRIRLI